MTPVVFSLADVQAVMTIDLAIESARRALVAAATGTVVNPRPWHLDLRDVEGEVHVKGAALHGSPVFAIKTSTGFPRNAQDQRPTAGGYTSVFDSTTGQLLALMLDDGYLTELRTGAAGAVALDTLAPPQLGTVVLVGTGGQARHQLDGILAVRAPAEIVLVGRRQDAAESFADWARQRTTIAVKASTDIESSVRRADAVITVTSTREPIVLAEWIHPGIHITALGADSPGKRELDPRILAIAELIAVDDIDQSRHLGELQNVDDAARAGRLAVLGAILNQTQQGRRNPTERTIADLSGLGAQDAAIAEIAWHALSR